MPYEVKGKCVYKKDTGKKVGCTDGSIKKYLAALHMHANESLDSLEHEKVFLTTEILRKIVHDSIIEAMSELKI